MLPQRKFVKGLDASTPIYNQPPGTFSRGSNLVLTKRGGLKTVDGCVTLSLQDGAVQSNVGPVIDICLMQITTQAQHNYIAVVEDLTVNPSVYRVVYTHGVIGNAVPGSPSSYDLVTDNIGIISSVDGNIRIQQFNNQIIFTTGNQSPIYYWCGYSTAPYWLAQTATTLNTVVSYVQSGTTYMFQATAITDAAGGVTGVSVPNWDYTTGHTTVDNTVTWTCLGPNQPTPLLNQFQVVYPQWSSGTAITVETIIQVAFYSVATEGSPSGTMNVWQPHLHVYVGYTIGVVSGTNAYTFIVSSIQPPPSIYAPVYTGSVQPNWDFTVGNITTETNGGYTISWKCVAVVASSADNTNYVLCKYWLPNTRYATGSYIVDSNNNVQKGSGTSGPAPPAAWNTTLGGTSSDGGITWTCEGPATFFNFTAVQGGTTSQQSQIPNFVAQVNSRLPDSNVIWQNTGLTANSALAPRGARAAVVYAGSLWVLNTQLVTTADNADGPTALRMSELNNANSWNPINVAFLGKDDGTEGTALATFTIAESGITPTGSLVAFKDYSTYQIIGVFGSSDFQIIKAQTDMGCIADDTVQFIPGYGIGRLSHLGPALFDGVRDKLFGEEIRPYLFGGEPDITPIDSADIRNSWAAQCINPPMYILACPLQGQDGALSRLFCYDLVLKAWAAPIDLPWPISCIRQIRHHEGGVAVVTLVGSYNDGSIRQLFGGATSWDNTPTTGQSQAVSWSVRSPEVFGKSAADGIYSRCTYLRGIGVNASGVKAALTGDLVALPAQQMRIVQLANGTFEAWLPLHMKGKSVHADISGSGPVELLSIDWDVEAQPAAPSVLL